MVLLWSAWVSTSPAAPAPAAVPAVRVENAWIRWLPAGIPAGGYVTIFNDGSRPVTLIGAESAAYAEVSLHSTRTQNGVSQMLPVARIVIEPHTSVNFAVAGYHIMLMQPSKPVNPGDRIPVTLRFADGTLLNTDFMVRRPDGS